MLKCSRAKNGCFVLAFSSFAPSLHLTWHLLSSPLLKQTQRAGVVSSPLATAVCLGTSYSLVDSHHMISSALPARIHSGGHNIRQMPSECCSISSQSSWTCSTWKACFDGSRLASFKSHSLTTQFSNMSPFSASRIALVSTKDSPISQLRHGCCMFQAFNACVTLQDLAHQSIRLCTNLFDSMQPISMCRHSPCTTPVQVVVCLANSPNKKYRFTMTQLCKIRRSSILNSRRQQKWLFKVHRIHQLARHVVCALKR